MRSAIATGMVDYVLPPARMPEQLIAYVRHAFARPPQAAPATRDGDFIRKLCALLRAHTSHDFSQYKETTLVRRVERRIGREGENRLVERLDGVLVVERLEQPPALL